MTTACRPTQIILSALTLLGILANPQCQGQFFPPPSSVKMSARTASEPVVVQVSVELVTSCHRVDSWGEPRMNGSIILVDAHFSVIGESNSLLKEEIQPNIPVCLQYIRTESHDYKLGLLAPGPYSFVFQSMGLPLKTLDFSVPVLLSASSSAGASRIDFKWYTDSNAWYRLEQRTELVANSWMPLTEWLPGNGGLMMTNTVVATGQGQKFYRLVGSYSEPIP